MALELLKKSVNMGLGLVALGQEKVKSLGPSGMIARAKDARAKATKFVANLEKKGKASKGRVSKLVKDVVARTDKGVTKVTALRGKAGSVVGGLMSKMPIPTKSDIDALNVRIDKLLKKKA